MDFYKLQKKHKLKEKEIVKEMKIQADKMLDLIGTIEGSFKKAS